MLNDENYKKIIIYHTKDDEELFIKELQKYLYVDDTTLIDAKKNEQITVFIGDSPYSKRKRGRIPKNVAPFSVYKTFGFNEVAFLCDIKTLELFSIIGIMCDSLDRAAKLINCIFKQNLMDAFAKYLWFQKRVLLVNAANQYNKINNLLLQYKNHRVLLCCGKKHKLYSFTSLNRKMTNNKYDNFMTINHPSPNAYRMGFVNNCEAYLDRTYKDQNSNLFLKSFVVL